MAASNKYKNLTKPYTIGHYKKRRNLKKPETENLVKLNLMKLEKNIEKFIELRIAGNSFEEISKELQTSKQSLIEWNKKVEIRTAITEGKAFKINNLVKANNCNLENRLKSYLQLSKKINDELLNRDLLKVSTETLLKMSIATDNRLREIINKSFQIGENPGFLEIGLNEDGYFHLNLED